MSDLSPADAELVLQLVDTALFDRLHGRASAAPALDELPASLQRPAGVFVTLTVNGDLNGCIGSIEPREPLGIAAPRLGISAAFSDPRLPTLHLSDYPNLDIEVSILSSPILLAAASRAELIEQLRPGVDGLIIEAGRSRALFLPDVWESLPDPDDFLDHLWQKARLGPRTWPAGLRASSFTTERHHRHAGCDRSRSAGE